MPIRGVTRKLASSMRSTSSSGDPGAARRPCWWPGASQPHGLHRRGRAAFRLRRGPVAQRPAPPRLRPGTRATPRPAAHRGLSRDPGPVARSTSSAMRRLAAVLLAQNDIRHSSCNWPTGSSASRAARWSERCSGARAHHNESNPQMAVASFERVLELDPGLREMPALRKSFWDQLAKDLVECGRIEDSCHRLEQALLTERTRNCRTCWATPTSSRATSTSREPRHRQAMEWDPGFYCPHLNLAKLELLFRRHDDALRQLSQALVAGPPAPNDPLHPVLMYRQLGQNAEVCRSSRRSRRSRSCAGRPPRSPESPPPPGHATHSDRTGEDRFHMGIGRCSIQWARSRDPYYHGWPEGDPRRRQPNVTNYDQPDRAMSNPHPSGSSRGRPVVLIAVLAAR